MLTNFQEKFEQIIENEEVEDAVELNEKFLSQHLNVNSEDLSKITKIELRVDTSCHNLQMIGEILCSIEYLKMNDSIIKCFRDIGSSFKFVRVLHLARCELREVQGIQAFEHLEELYLSYNDIDELFDIGFLEHLTVLDLEGNNIKNLDQLFYLRRCQSLTDVNLKYNPVQQEVTYYQKLQENLPRIQYLDDDLVVPSSQAFFEKKTDESKKLAFMKNIKPHAELSSVSFSQIERDIIARFVRLGAREDLCYKWCEEAIQSADKEPAEAELLTRAIKNFSKEKKSQNVVGYDSEDEFFFDDDGGMSMSASGAGTSTPMSRKSKMRGTMSSFKIKRRDDGTIVLQEKSGTNSNNREEPGGQQMNKTAYNSFYKATTRSTTISSKLSQRSVFYGNGAVQKNSENNQESGVSELVSNTDRVIAGTPFSILKNKREGQSQK